VRQASITLPDGKQKTVELKPLKGRYIKKAWALLEEATKDETDLSGITKYYDYLDEVGSKISGMTVEELDDLDIDDKLKITGLLNEKLQQSLGFIKPSLNAGVSLPEIKPGR